ncbi:iron complex outermembrane receptor protein [termite gut metagenome]|uniref:Iron complex outermembrane receptor protein n=1 Tax=termite gut metagenome TaxID=433724 RepID=A0A5J4RXC3_9ZZZZ
MKQNPFINRRAARWKQFSHKAYAVFRSLKKEVNIGVLAVSTLLFANANTISAQNETSTQTKIYELGEIEITGTRVPLTEMQSAKPVMIFSRNDIQAAAAHSINDLLEYAASVDVRQRGEFGIQTDISVRGGTFDQITILLNGVTINNPQTGHLTADFPVSVNDIERIEIIEGPAARVFGTSAFTGVINIVTRAGKQNRASVHLMSGEYGLFGGDASVNLTKNTLSQHASVGYQRSDGATKNSDFNVSRAYYQGTHSSAQADVHWQLGYSNRAYGANTFYSASYPNQSEETSRYLLSVQAETKGQLHFTPVIYWNRSYDHFQLIRNTQTGENFHLNDVYGINLNTYFNSFLGKTAFGTEMRNEGILSTNLGKPLEEGQYVTTSGENGTAYNKKDNRTNVSYYLEHNILLEHLTVSLGVMANMNTALGHTYRLYPGIDMAYRPNHLWKFFASWNKALRMPTFTDLYYKSPTLQGNIGLKPEETHAAGIGAKYRNMFIEVNAYGFYHKGKNMIDWVMYSSDDVYHSANFKLDNIGVETSAVFHFRQLVSSNFFLDRLNIGYTYIYQQRHDDTEIYKSNYALEYLRHKFTARLNHRIWKNLSAEWAFRWQNRMGSYQKYIENKPTSELVPYPSFDLLDLKLFWEGKNYHIFAEANNLLNRTYYDLGNIPQPGFWFKAGAGWKINFK